MPNDRTRSQIDVIRCPLRIRNMLSAPVLFFCIRIFLTIIIFSAPLISPLAAGGFEFRFSPEAGVFNQSNGNISNEYLLTLASINARFRHQMSNQQLQFDLKFRPEFYTADRSISILHIYGQASYRRTGRIFDSEITVIRKRQNYYENDFNLYTDITQGFVRGCWKISSRWALDIQPVLSRRTLTGAQEHTLNSGMATVLLSHHHKPTLTVNAGPYIETYKISLPFRAESPRHNTGWAAGPMIQFSYQDDFVTQWTYSVIKRNSLPVNENSVEHRINGLWGKTFSGKWSAFLYVEYSYRIFRHTTDRDVDLFYSLTNDENRMYAKISYEWEPKSEWFVKAGFMAYELYQSSARFAGLQMTTGIDWKF